MLADAFMVALRKSNKSMSDHSLIATTDLVESLKSSLAIAALLCRRSIEKDRRFHRKRDLWLKWPTWLKSHSVFTLWCHGMKIIEICWDLNNVWSCVLEIPTTAVTCTTNKSTSDQILSHGRYRRFVESFKCPLALAVESLHDPCYLIWKGSHSSCANNPFKRNDGMQADLLWLSEKVTNPRAIAVSSLPQT